MSEEIIDQGAMVDDFFESQELVYQDSGDPVESIDDDQEELNVTPTKTENAVPEVETTETEKITENDDPFAFMATDESGETKFRALDAMEFIQRKNAAKEETFKPELPPIADARQESSPTEEVMPYDQAVKSLQYSAFEYMEDFIRQGYDPATAMHLAKQSVDRDTSDYLRKHELQEMEKRMMSQFEEKKTAKEKEIEMAELRPLSTKNLYEVAKSGGYGTVQELQAALMKPEYGGNFIYHQFMRDSQGKTYKSEAERTQAINDWFIKYTSDKQNVYFLESVARAQINNKLFPEIIKHARATAQKVEKSNSAAKGMRTVTAQNHSRTNPATKTPNALEQYLGRTLDEV